MSIKPILKWVGGKTQLIGTLNELIPSQLLGYHECFLGGATVLFHILSEIEASRITLLPRENSEQSQFTVSDLNPHLIDMYVNVRDRVHPLLKELIRLFKTYNDSTSNYVRVKREKIVPKSTLELSVNEGKDYVYYYYRSEYNRLKKRDRASLNENEQIYKSALFLCLNKMGWRGVYRENRSGEFNVPFGNYRQVVLDQDNIKEVSKLLQKYKVTFTCQSFVSLMDLPHVNIDREQLPLEAQMQSLSVHDSEEEKIETVRPLLLKGQSLVYLDPPYVPINDTSFTDYSSTEFGDEAHQSVLDLCKSLHDKGYRWILSNSDTQLVKDAFRELIERGEVRIRTVNCRRSIRSDDPSATANELIVSNVW